MGCKYLLAPFGWWLADLVNSEFSFSFLLLQTRIAAAQAIEAILQNVPQWQPKPSVVKSGSFSQTPFLNFLVNSIC